ncbi:MAG: FISUMP domain-containing protein, partial [Ignavibacteriaceae bacterium]|nr:FISUMP domain-containing protein [Ignavibacteriaceae bacterium]
MEINEGIVYSSDMSGEFRNYLIELTANTEYYVRAFAKNSSGIGYGLAIQFTTKPLFDCGEIIDSRDGNVYSTVVIGNDCWMAENLKYLPSLSNSLSGTCDFPSYYVYNYNNTSGSIEEAQQTENYDGYGVLYNIGGLTTACPAGWHLPVNEEWQAVLNYLQTNYNIPSDQLGNALKSCWMNGNSLNGAYSSTDVPYWQSYLSTRGLDLINFSALPGGKANSSGVSSLINQYGYWWIGDIDTHDQNYRLIMLNYQNGEIDLTNGGGSYGYSVRCVKNSDVTDAVPTVTTLQVSDVTKYSAFGSGVVVDNGGATILQKGFVISEIQNPDYNNNNGIFLNTDDSSYFSCDIINLKWGTTYYCRAFARNQVGISYGEEIVFETDSIPTCGLLVDERDGNEYKTVRFGNQCWFAENLRYMPYYSLENEITQPYYSLEDYLYPLHCLSCAKNTERYSNYGVLYNYTGAVTSCPQGWTLPNDDDWGAMLNYLVAYGYNYDGSIQGNKIAKSLASVSGWSESLNWPGSPTYQPSTNNSSGFTALPEFSDQHVNSWWSKSNNYKWFIRLSYPQLLNNSYYTSNFGYVRCFKPYEPDLPTVYTILVSDVFQESAKTGGIIADNGGSEIIQAGIVWSTSSMPTLENNDGFSIDTICGDRYISYLTGLNPEVLYYVRSYAKNSDGVNYGAQYQFLTAPYNPPPSVHTVQLLNYTHTTAKVTGIVTDDGGNEVCDRGFVWSTNPHPTIHYNTGISHDASGLGSFVSFLTFPANLSSIYYVRSYAINADSTGVGYGELLIIEMNDTVVPTIETLSVFNVTYDGADFETQILSNTMINVFSRGVIWSDSAMPTMDNNIGYTSDSSGLGVYISQIRNLNAGTEYFVRPYATIEDSVVYGDILTFQTIDTAAPATSFINATDIKMSSAVLLGSILDDGGGNVIERGFVLCEGATPEINSESNVVSCGNGIGNYSVEVDALEAGVLYYVRAYAINEVDTSYSDVGMFRTLYAEARINNVGVYDILPVRARVEFEIVDRGAYSIIEKGVIWSLNPDFDYENCNGIQNQELEIITFNYGVGILSAYLNGLLSDTTYYYKSYVKCEEGIFYSSIDSFKTTSFPHCGNIEYEGESYKTIVIGQQCWMAENLRNLPQINIPEESSWVNPRYYVFDNFEKNIDEVKATSIYQNEGVLYNFTAALNQDDTSSNTPSGIRGACPLGWHLPSEGEWLQMLDYLGSNPIYTCDDNSNYIQKSLSSTVLWTESSGQCSIGNQPEKNNLSGFNAYPAGKVEGLHYQSRLWAACFYTSEGSFYNMVYFSFADITDSQRDRAYSVRCVKDLDFSEGLADIITGNVDNITDISAIGRGNVSDFGGSIVSERGLVYSNVPSPTITSNIGRLISGSGNGQFECVMSDLEPGTTYYVRAYAINLNGIAYGQQVTYQTNQEVEVPIISSVNAINPESFSVNLEASLTSDGGGIITECGFVWSNSQTPTTSSYDGIEIVEMINGNIVSDISNLSPETNYQIRAFASNSAGTGYSSILNFETQDTSAFQVCGDSLFYEGTLYGTKPFGSYCWFTENLKYLPYVTPGYSFSTNNPKYYVWGYSGNDINQAKDTYSYKEFGVYYNSPAGLAGPIYTIGDVTYYQGPCPAGWYIPSTNEWDSLVFYLTLNGYTYDGQLEYRKVAKSMASTSYWATSDVDGAVGCHPENNNESGFNALPGGYISSESNLDYTIQGLYAKYFTINWEYSNNLYSSKLQYNSPYYSYIDTEYDSYAMPIRCVRASQQIQLPDVNTNEVSSITVTSAVISGVINSTGNVTEISKGFVWSTNPNPTVTLNSGIVYSDSEQNDFISQLNFLDCNTVYYVRAFATNSLGTSYGQTLSFTTDVFTGCVPLVYEGYTYETVEIGCQCWMAENLKYLPSVSPISVNSPTNPNYYVMQYNGSSIMEAMSLEVYDTLGVLYNWPAAQVACPEGWRLPNENDWFELEINLGMGVDEITLNNWRGENEGSKLAGNLSYWNLGNLCEISSNLQFGSSNFNALPAGAYLGPIGGFGIGPGWDAVFWSSEYDNEFAWNRWLNSAHTDVKRNNSVKESGFSVRCIRDLYEMSTTPAVTTISINSVGPTFANISIDVQSDGGSLVTDRGVLWSLNPNPTISDCDGSKHQDFGTGSFICDVTGLMSDSTYYFRAFATNSRGTSYGEELTATTTSMPNCGLVDYQGYYYKTIMVGEHCWFAENLRYLPSVYTPTQTSQVSPRYYIADFSGNDVGQAMITDNYQIYGVLYNFKAAVNSCPSDWHLPDDQEWTYLERFYCDDGLSCEFYFPDNPETFSYTRGTDEGSKLASNADLWGNGIITQNEAFGTSGFNCLPGGSLNDSYSEVGYLSTWWSDNTVDDGLGIRRLSKGSTIIVKLNIIPNAAYVRCIKSYLPSVITNETDDVDYESAFLNGRVLHDGGEDIIESGFVYSLNNNPTVETNDGILFVDIENGELNGIINNLEGNSIYYYRAFATSLVGTAYGDEISFLTEIHPVLPVVTTGPVDAIVNNTYINVDANISSNGGSSIFNRGFVYNTTLEPTLENNLGTVFCGVGTGEFDTILSGLLPTTTYYLRAFAENIEGVSYGNEVVFSTQSVSEPILSQVIINPVEQTRATITVAIASDGMNQITSKGVLWGNSENIDLENNLGTSVCELNPNVFSILLTDLSSAQLYYLKAFVITSVDTIYSDLYNFTTLDFANCGLVEYEGYSYKTVVIGDQCWFAENLRYLPSVSIPSSWSQTNPMYYVYGYSGIDVELAKSTENYAKYGVLYNYPAALIACPQGWSLPNVHDRRTVLRYICSNGDCDQTIPYDFANITTYVGTDEGSKSAKNKNYWTSGNLVNHIDFGISGFNAIPAGVASIPNFQNLNSNANFWLSDNYNSTSAKGYYIRFDRSAEYSGLANKANGQSVRCFKNLQEQFDTVVNIITTPASNISHFSANSGGY